MGCPGELGWTVLSEPDVQRGGVVLGCVCQGMGWEPVSMGDITLHRVIARESVLIRQNWFRSENGENAKTVNFHCCL